MTVKELKEKLEQFDDNLIVMIPNRNWEDPYEDPWQKYNIPARHVSQGINEFDSCLFIDDYEEED